MKIKNSVLKIFSHDYYIEKQHHHKTTKRPSKEEVDVFKKELAVVMKNINSGKNLREPNKKLNPKLQRCLDLIISSGIVIPCSIAAGLAALITKATNPHKDAFHIQKRLGKGGKEFNVIKIRTVEKLPSGWRMLSNFSEFLRKYSIDEFPQLINVFKGEMSLVGPRPVIYRDIMQTAKTEGLDFVAQKLMLKPGFGFGYEKGRQTIIPKVEQEKIFMKDRGIKTYGKTIMALTKTILKGCNS